MRILVTGQLSLHWGRMENGNIGNYYIIEPFFKELNRAFPNAEIATTIQMSENFAERENIEILPLNLYYSWDKTDLPTAEKEFEIAKIYNKTSIIGEKTPYIEEVLKSDLVIDFSGDMWGKNADLAGEDRFKIGLLKNKIAQLLKKKTILFSCSPGPFDDSTLEFAKDVYSSFDLVTLREPVSKTLLEIWGFDLSKTQVCACQSVLFQEEKQENIIKYLDNNLLTKTQKPQIGFMLCGWNMEKGPFNREDYENSEFNNFVELIEYCCQNLNANIYLLSHSNGFELPPNFKLIHGRDYHLLKKLYSIIETKPWKNNVHFFKGIYSPAETKAIVKNFDILISGRVHGAIAGLSSCIPTVIIDYGHEPKAHKLQGFAKLYEIEEYIANPLCKNDLINRTRRCFENISQIKEHLNKTVPKIKTKARNNVELVKELF